MSQPEETIAAVYLWVGGMIMAFDQNGEQLPDYQGRTADVAERILKDAGPGCEFWFGKWRENAYELTREEWRLLALPLEEPR